METALWCFSLGLKSLEINGNSEFKVAVLTLGLEIWVNICPDLLCDTNAVKFKVNATCYLCFLSQIYSDCIGDSLSQRKPNVQSFHAGLNLKL